MIYLITVTALYRGEVVQWRYSTGAGWIDDSGNVYEPRVIQAGNVSRRIALATDGNGAGAIGYGEVVLANADGGLDHWLDAALDGRPIEITTNDGAAVLSAAVGGVEINRSTVTLRIRDAATDWAERLVITRTYGGTNAPPAGLDGNSGDRAGQTWPHALGRVRHVEPPVVNTSAPIFQLASEGPVTVLGVFEGGAPITAAADYTALSQLDTVAPALGQYRAYPGTATEGAYFCLGSSPARRITVSVTEGPTSASRSALEVMRRALRLAGVPASQVTVAPLVGVMAAAEVGYWLESGDGVRVGDVLSHLARSVHGYWSGTRDGRIQIGVLAAPEEPVVLDLDDAMVLTGGTSIERRVNGAEGLPVWRVKVGYQRNWTPQTRDQLVGSVTAANVEELQSPYRYVSRQDLAIRGTHPAAPELVIDTCIDGRADAEALRDLLWSLYAVQRDQFAVAVPADVAALVDLGECVRLTLPRLGLLGGRLFRVVGIEDNLARNQSVLTLWG